MQNKSESGVLFVLAAATLWGTTGTAQALAPEMAQPPAVGALRLLIGAVGLVLIAFGRRAFQSGGHWPLMPTLIGGVSIAAYQVAFFTGVDRTGVAVGTIVGIGSAPIMSGALSFLLGKSGLTLRWFISTTLAVIGCTLLVTSGDDIGVEIPGVLMAMGAGLSYAIYTQATKEIIAYQPPDAVMAVLFAFGALLLLPILLQYDLSWTLEPRGILTLLHLGLLATTLSYVFFARGLRHVEPPVAVTLSLAEPLTAGLLGVIILGEKMTPLAFMGIVLLFAGLAVLARRPGRSRPNAV